MTAPLLNIANLSVRFRAGPKTVHAVNGASLSVRPGETVCVVGESGSGKSVTATAAMGLLPRNADVSADRLQFGGQDLRGLSERQWRPFRGDRIGMIFQDPMVSLNPAHTIGLQMTEGLKRHRGLTSAAARARAVEVLDMVRIPDAATRLGHYPHQLSGGMRQRVVIAMALICEPRLLIADEPTTALDVTIQAQILSLMDELKRDLGIAILFITHDLGVVADIADRVVVMYAGTVVESAGVCELFDAPAHPYTLGLMGARPSGPRVGDGRLAEIAGAVPRLTAAPSACLFAPRCPRCRPECTWSFPGETPVAAGHMARCLYTVSGADAENERAAQ